MIVDNGKVSLVGTDIEKTKVVSHAMLSMAAFVVVTGDYPFC